MRFNVSFQQSQQSFRLSFGEVQNVSDGGYEKGYAEGVSEGYATGHTEGYADGLAARTYETWSVTYVDGTVEDVKVALL